MVPSALPYLEEFPIELVRGMVVTNSAVVRSRGVRHPDHFVASFFGRPALSHEYLIGLLSALPEGTTELMCHPGHMGSGLAGSTYRQEREEELAVLTHRAVRRAIEEQGIELISFSSL